MRDAVIERQLGAVPETLAGALAARDEILRLSQASHDAVLVPAAAGGISHAERAALAARMARLNEDAALASQYDELLARTDASSEIRAIADPAVQAASPRLAAIVRHVDLLSRKPRSASRADIEALKEAGISEPDIVRISELAAFVNYQVRVIAGLKLLKDIA